MLSLHQVELVVNIAVSEQFVSSLQAAKNNVDNSIAK